MIDANQQRFWMLADEPDWVGPATGVGVEYDRKCRRLRLRDETPKLRGTLIGQSAEDLLGVPARAVDPFGTVAFWNDGARSVQVTGGSAVTSAPITIYSATPGESVADLAMGFDDVLYLALQRAGADPVIGMFDPRGRWRHPPVFTLELGQNFSPNRIAADPSGGIWMLDRARRRIGRVRGLPLRDDLPPEFSETTFRPVEENPFPPRFDLGPHQPQWQGPAERPVALACSPEGQVAVISWDAADDTWLHLRDMDGNWAAPRLLENAGKPASVAWYSADRIVVLPASRTLPNGHSSTAREALAFDPADATPRLQPAGIFLPLRDLHSQALFLQGVTLPPRYPMPRNRNAALLPLSIASYSSSDTTAYGRVIDGEKEQTVWHRLYLEAVFPAGCGAIVELAATDEPDKNIEEKEWHPHLFGEVPTPAFPADRPPDVPENMFLPPRGVWSSAASEIPHHPGVLCCARERNRSGLFVALAQSRGRRVRRLAGRYLHTRVTLFGAGHRTPELAALRVFGSRFSYRDQYLAEIYREDLFGKDASAVDSPTGADFLERFLSLFEGVLTPLEDRVAAAQVLMDAWSTPEEALEWLGSWIGVVFDPAFSKQCRRAWLSAAHQLFQTRGTLAGVQLALEIATGGRLVREQIDGREREFASGGSVTGGEVIVLEDFRLRRTFATILGANLSLPDDPLLPGLIASANSRVGDTLFLGDVEKVELLALFRDAFSSVPQIREREVAAVREFYGRLAHRATVFVHNDVEPQNFRLLERIAEQEAPAHLQIRVVPASYPLLVGLASLVDIDTYLVPAKRPGVVQLNRSRIGENAFIKGPPSLDPRFGGMGPAGRVAPVARIAGPPAAQARKSFSLDASTSTSAPGQSIERYVWSINQTPP
jgi:phage tail-like protein